MNPLNQPTAPIQLALSFNRRHFLTKCSLAALATTLPVGAKPARKRSQKKGICLTMKTPNWAQRVESLHPSWVYTWGGVIPPDLPKDVGFVPMVFSYWGQSQQIKEMTETAKKAGIRDLLGFNEPDKQNQGNLTVERALKAWPILMETGMRLGSPGCVHPDKEWMKDFMKGAKERGYRVDYVCVHSYGGPNAKALGERLKRVHEMFGLPIWITEFAVGDWEAKTPADNRHKPRRVLEFAKEALPMLEKMDFVERYCWFPAGTDNRALGTSAVFENDGELTPLGKFYRDFQG